MARSTELRLRDILHAIATLHDGLDGLASEIVLQRPLLKLALERGLEVISEASRHIPPELKADFAHIDWRNIARMGDLIRHHYHRVDVEVLWAVFQRDLDPLEAAVRDLLARYDGGSGSSGSAAR